MVDVKEIIQLLLNFFEPASDLTIPVDLMRCVNERDKDQDRDDDYHYCLDSLVTPAVPQAANFSVTGIKEVDGYGGGGMGDGAAVDASGDAVGEP